LKAAYLDNVPVRVSEASDPAEAAVCAEQLRNLDAAKCTPLLLEYKELLLPSLEVRAAGGEIQKPLQDELMVFEFMKLDENIADGVAPWHSPNTATRTGFKGAVDALIATS
jgi:hypothetical protein